MNDFDFTGMSEQERNRYTVGELIDALTIDTIVGGGVGIVINREFAETEDLMRAAEIGKYLLYEAVCTADDEDNAQFFEAAYGFYGPLIDTVLQECGRDYRNSQTGQARASR
jgi:hypothetical protein